MPALLSKRPSAGLGEIHRELDRRRRLAAVAKERIMKKSSAPSPIPNAATGAAIQNKPAPIPHEPAGAAIKNSSRSTPRAPAIAYVPLEEAPRRCTAPKGRPAMFPFPRNVSGVAKGGIQKSPAPMTREPAGAAIKSTCLQMPRKPAGAATKSSSATISRAPDRVATKKSSALVSPTTPPLLPSSTASESVKKGSTVRVRTRVGTLPSGLRLVLWLSAFVVSDAEDGYLEVLYNGDFPRGDPFRTVRVARDQVKSMPSQQ